jgi:thioredoxin reductase (NADPH)
MPLESIVVGDENLFDVLVIGGGIAGLTACIFCAKANFKVGFIEKNVPGGKLVEIKKITNYPGFESISGPDLALKLYEQATNIGAKYILGEVKLIDKKDRYHAIYTSDGVNRFAKAIIIASGTIEEQLKAKGIEKYINSGVSYCATCDGNLAKNKKIMITGNNYAKIIDSINYLNNLSSSIYVVCFDENFDFSEFKNNKRIIIKSGWKVEEIFGNDEKMTSVSINKNNEIEKIPTEFIFICNNMISATSFINEKKIICNSTNIVINDYNKSTDVKGIFAAGDVARTNHKLLVTAASDGAVAALSAIKYIQKE